MYIESISYPKTETFSFRKVRGTETLEISKSLPKIKATVFKDISCLLSQTNNYLQQLYKKQ